MESGDVEIDSRKLNDARWVQVVTLPPGLYNVGVDILVRGIPPDSWAGAFISVGDQGVASLDVKGNSNWVRREIFFKTSDEKTKVEVKLRVGGLTNFTIGRAVFRNATLAKIDNARTGAMVL